MTAKLQNLTLDDAKRLMRSLWSVKCNRYDLDIDDAYTDAFWDGRLWAIARVLHLIPEQDREQALELLSIYPREREEIGA